MDKILLIDGLNFVWRAAVKFGAPQQDTDDSVIYTFNFFRNLRPLIELLSPDKVFFVLEGRAQFRFDLFADYKATRIFKQASKKEETGKVFQAANLIVELLQHLPITVARAANYEADDTVGTLCQNMKEEDITIISNDSDYIQLLQRGYSNIKIYNPIKKDYMVAPDYLYLPWKCLNGDKSDNIPSLLTPAKATKTVSDPVLFKKFLEIEENRANFNINKQLIELRNVPEDEVILKEGIQNFTELKKAFQDLKFESIVNDKSWTKFTNTFSCIKF